MSILSAKNKLLFKSLLLSLVLTFSGCVYILVGGLGAVGGYIVSPDTVEGVSHNEISNVWDASIEVVSMMGLIIEKNEKSGYILAKVNGAKITINIETVSESSVKLTIKSRKFGLPKVSTAQDVFVKIMSYLTE